MKINAAIAEAPDTPFRISECELAAPGEGELLLRVEACGICHTDIAAKQQAMPVSLPAVLGHEGVGTILELGPGVTDYAPGDRVVVSFGSCGQCRNCQNDAPGYCDFGMVYMTGNRPDGRQSLSYQGAPVTGHFFAQSSMASHAVVSSRNAVKLSADFPAEIAAPLACGVQTGAGTVLIALNAQPGSSIAIAGCGTVGLSAVMAAKIAGCESIVAIDVVAERLELAKELGATRTVLSKPGMAEELLESGGVDYAFDTTGIHSVAIELFNALKARGTLVCAGIAKPGDTLNLDMNALMASGKHVRGVIEGDAVPGQFIPELIAYYHAGKLPVDKIIRTYPFESINQAIDDTHSGKVVKPVLMMSAEQGE